MCRNMYLKIYFFILKAHCNEDKALYFKVQQSFHIGIEYNNINCYQYINDVFIVSLTEVY